MKIEAGTPEDHPTPLPLDAAQSPGVAAVTPRFPPSATEQGGVRDLTGERLSQLAAGEAAAASAMHAGMQADADRRAHYEAALAPLGASAIDEITLPPVPAYTLPPPPVGGYPWQGDEPVPAG